MKKIFITVVIVLFLVLGFHSNYKERIEIAEHTAEDALTSIECLELKLNDLESKVDDLKSELSWHELCEH